MTKFIPVRVSYDDIVIRLTKEPALAGVPTIGLHTLIVTACVSAMYYLNDTNSGLRFAAYIINQLAERVLTDAGLTDRATQDAAFQAVDRIYADEYEKAFNKYMAEKEQTTYASVES